MKSNFDFLDERWPILASLGSLAEKYLYNDSNTCFLKLGLFGETIVKYMLAYDKIDEPDFDNTHANRIKLLKRNGLIPKDIDDILFAVRITRNDAIHEAYESVEKAQTLLELTYKLGAWFMQCYGDWSYEPIDFVVPENEITNSIELENINRIQEDKIITLTEQLAIVKSNVTKTDFDSRRTKTASAAEKINLSEKETRYIIDDQLRQVGWEADSQELQYSKGTRPQKGKNIAIAEWPTDSKILTSGAVDYALFKGMQLIGIIEAKRKYVDIPSVIDYQCKDYARNIKEEHDQYVINKWNDYKVPFLYATNGRKYLKQLETKSGIWFLDARESSNIPYALTGWPSPKGLWEEIEKDINKSNGILQKTSLDLLEDPAGLNLRPYQIEAVKAVEAAVIAGEKTLLVAMATGTGKTRTVLGIIYRLIKAERFRRVLFLVDRTALGEQAEDTFKDVKIEDLMTIDKIYDLKSLEEKDFDTETKIHIATVQGLVKRIMYNDSEVIPAVTDYDLIVIDEAHRGYILDKEMGDDELLYRDQTDFISKYRTVIEYFDAVKIALTATPALHTTEIFGKPIFNYLYREAVIEGYLIDHDAPHIINTKLKLEGINYQVGETVAIYDPVTGEITNSEELADELNFDVESFNKQVITEDFNRTVLTEIAQYINPEGEGKTLIFAVDNTHADLIVKILKEIYQDYGVDNDAIRKITGSVGGGNPKKVSAAIKQFKNEKYPNIAVTVDLLTTGIDVEEITTLVFMRRVKSRILFEQMLGRATRLCPEIGKTHFEIFDPIGVYESLQPVSTMKPVVSNAAATYLDLINGLDILETPQQRQNQIDMIIAKLQRQKRNINNKTLEHFIDLSGGKKPDEFINELRKQDADKAAQTILNKYALFAMLNEGLSNSAKPVIVSDKPDVLLEHKRGYGTAEKPEDYLQEFREFINENINKIAALNIVCTRPKELTRKELKSLKLELDRNKFNEVQLNSAWKELKNEDITADIISFIRQQALGTTLISHEERMKNAILKVKKNHSFNKIQLDWLNRIEKQLLHESIVDKETFDTGAFKSKGGFTSINKIFKNELEKLIEEINQNLYEERGVI